MRLNRPHIPSTIHQFQRARTQNKQPHPKSGVSAVVSPEFPAAVSGNPRFHPPASLRRVLFGEAVFRSSIQNPQDLKSLPLSFSCHTQRLKGIFKPKARSLANPKTSTPTNQSQIPRINAKSLPNPQTRFANKSQIHPSHTQIISKTDTDSPVPLGAYCATAIPSFWEEHPQRSRGHLHGRSDAACAALPGIGLPANPQADVGRSLLSALSQYVAWS